MLSSVLKILATTTMLTPLPPLSLPTPPLTITHITTANLLMGEVDKLLLTSGLLEESWLVVIKVGEPLMVEVCFCLQRKMDYSFREVSQVF